MLLLRKAFHNQIARTIPFKLKKVYQTFFFFDIRRKQQNDINGYKETEQVTCLVDVIVLATIKTKS